MTLTTTISGRGVWGNHNVVFGKGVISGDTATGDVATGLAEVTCFTMSVQGGTQKGHSVNETLPLASGDVTVVTESDNQTFYWIAIGKG